MRFCVEVEQKNSLCHYVTTAFCEVLEKQSGGLVQSIGLQVVGADYFCRETVAGTLLTIVEKILETDMGRMLY